ncbi:MAG: hypothetical protein ACYCSI_04620 [Solirubrobacteraceae bacterium]
MSDAQLDAVPPEGSFRFADGTRTFEGILAGAFKHQARQIEALAGVLASDLIARSGRIGGSGAAPA